MSVAEPLTARAAPAGLAPPSSAPPPHADLPDASGRLGRAMPTDRLRGWFVALSLTLIAGILRIQYLYTPTDAGTPVFDEKHYVPQAWEMLRNGGYEDNPGYELTVHPPLGKTMIAFGEWIFGYNGWGWRFSSAIVGTLMVLIIVRVARRMTRSTLLGGIAGVLLICDGLSHLQSRMGMLDSFLAFFVLLAFAFLIADRDQVRHRLAIAVREGWADESPFGPRLGFRWWRFACGVSVGLACGVKWSGVYWVAAFAVLAVLFDVTARRAAGVARPWVGTLVRDVAPAFWALAVIPVLAYLACWWSWFGAETAVDRHVIELPQGEDAGPAFLPEALRALWYYGGNVLNFHETLTTQKGTHPWESKPWAWPMGMRPMLYYYSYGDDTTGCGASECVRATMLIGTPAMWWLALPLLGFSLWRTVARFDWRHATVLVTYLAGIAPWFLNVDRQMFFFYMTPVAPFLVLGIVLVLGEILGRQRASFERRRTGILVVGLYVGLVVANFAWLWPILNGVPITVEHWNAQLWLPSWR